MTPETLNNIKTRHDFNVSRRVSGMTTSLASFVKSWRGISVISIASEIDFSSSVFKCESKSVTVCHDKISGRLRECLFRNLGQQFSLVFPNPCSAVMMQCV